MKQTFNKSERLCSPKIIERLFKRGSSEVHTFYLFPFRVLYIYESTPDPQQPTQVLFSISKRQFKKAVDRNLIRRRCREIYRVNKRFLYANDAIRRPAYIAFLYLAKDSCDFSVMDKAIQKILIRMGDSQNS